MAAGGRPERRRRACHQCGGALLVKPKRRVRVLPQIRETAHAFSRPRETADRRARRDGRRRSNGPMTTCSLPRLHPTQPNFARFALAPFVCPQNVIARGDDEGRPRQDNAAGQLWFFLDACRPRFGAARHFSRHLCARARWRAADLSRRLGSSPTLRRQAAAAARASRPPACRFPTTTTLSRIRSTFR